MASSAFPDAPTAVRGAGRVVIDATALPTHPGGVGTYVRSLIEHLPAAGVDPIVITGRSVEEKLPGAALRLAAAPRRRLARLAWEQTSLVRTVRRAAPRATVLHSPHYTMPLRAPGLARIVTIHDLTFFSRPEDHMLAKRVLFRGAVTNAALRADCLIAVSQRTADLLDDLVRPSIPVTVIHHGVDHTRFRPGVAADEGPDRTLLGQLGIGDDAPYILHVGTIEPRKNHSGLLRAYEILCAQIDSTRYAVPRLVLAGGAWDGMWERLHPHAQAIEAGTRGATVMRLGVVADDALPVLYRNAAVVVYPSFEEGYGLPVVEALACGTAVVTSGDSVMSELGGDAVLTVDPHDAPRIAQVILDALSGDAPDRATRLHVASGYRWEACAAAHAELYDRFL